MTPDQIQSQLHHQQAQIDQLAKLVPEIHAFGREVRDLTVKVTQYIERHDNLARLIERQEDENVQLRDRLLKVELVLAGHQKTINTVDSIRDKFIWTVLAFVLASCVTVGVLATQIKGVVK